MPPTMRIATIGLTSLFVALSTACPEGPRYPATWRSHAPEDGAAASAAETAPEPAGPLSAEAAAMHAWFRAIDAAEHTVVAGDLPGAREEGRRLAERLRGAAPPGPWVAIVSEITRDADALAGAETIEAAGMSVARLAHGCGNCHVSLDVRPDLPPMTDTPPRPAPGDPASVMRWHGWAAERMWEGLVGPSDDRWLRGTATFIELPGCEKGSDRCRETRALAQRAHIAPTLDHRATIYGELLATCADCHAASDGPMARTLQLQ